MLQASPTCFMVQRFHFNVLSLPTDVYRDYRSFDDRSFCRRLNLKGYIYTCYFWNLLIYFPVCHWIWGGGFWIRWDLEISLVECHPHDSWIRLFSMYPHTWSKKDSLGERSQHSSLMAAAIGTGLLWFGWFGFNSGGALRADVKQCIWFNIHRSCICDDYLADHCKSKRKWL